MAGKVDKQKHAYECYQSGMTRPNTIKSIVSKYGCSFGYAKDIVYGMSYLDWSKAVYPTGVKKVRTSDPLPTDSVDKFKVDATLNSDDEFDF